MDKRSLLLGLGIGIIVGALLMQLFLIGEQSSSQLKEIDKEINSIEIPPEQTPPNNDVKENVSKSDSAEDNDQEIKQNETVPAADSSNSEQKGGEYSETELPKTIILRVYSGATVTETASVMELNGIIANKDSFVQFTKSKNKQIRAGYFVVQSDSSDEQILNILTDQPIAEARALELSKQNNYPVIFSPET